MQTDPVIIYKDTEQKSIAAIDLQGWLADGWAIDPPETQELLEEPEAKKSKKLIAQIPSSEQ